MPEYRRAVAPGGTFFLTIVTERRADILTGGAAPQLLRGALAAARSRRPFAIDADVNRPRIARSSKVMVR